MVAEGQMREGGVAVGSGSSGGGGGGCGCKGHLDRIVIVPDAVPPISRRGRRRVCAGLRVRVGVGDGFGI
jgi:hypothetical protein